MNFWHNIKDLFVKNPKMAYVMVCRYCQHQYWGKTKFCFPENMCPCCEAKSLTANPSDISIPEREKMWRYLDDQENDCGCCTGSVLDIYPQEVKWGVADYGKDTYSEEVREKWR